MLIRVEDEKKRTFYMQEAIKQQWTVRQCPKAKGFLGGRFCFKKTFVHDRMRG
ncbi:hypothetical protein [Gordonibacter sp. 28C]|uniref:hypothetical protein n=1 Tax=Gordonibacter sp. 28C TaxID=2078569 RepID=UPI000DF8302C